jgi:hypothetical protein
MENRGSVEGWNGIRVDTRMILGELHEDAGRVCAGD